MFCCASAFICFQHTYEGLKPEGAGLPAPAPESFQHTYEGLKHQNKPKLKEARHGFQHTYEGLKLQKTRVRWEPGGVFSIPMRD